MHDDDFHSGARPMDALQGGMEMPHTQAPCHSENQNNPRSAGLDNVGQTWNSTSLGSAPASNPTNDKNKAH